ncbi:cytochrome P450 [Calocera viscosa TUFC12733]|uniref:Cytochrome P450 n=1 Tax=Calocera viscosa (strain TUFC12733) TaxID=1330018 RepID=A0A167K907_CALVF|nr:cytochrome P450 [Calocera viscosa TUFC12733]
MQFEARVSLLGIFAFLLFKLFSSRARKANVPVVGSSAFFGYKTAFKMLTSYKQTLVEGHAKYGKSPFQVPGMRAWVVYVGRALFEDLRKSRDDTLSFQEEINDSVSIEWTMGKSVAYNTWHNVIVRKQMTQQLGIAFPLVYDELCHAFDDGFPGPGDEWTELHHVHDVIQQIVCRGANRLFVGLPLCRHPEYTRISRAFTGSVAKAGFLIAAFPKFLKPFVAKYFSGAPAAIAGFEPFIIPIIEERRRRAAEMGDEWQANKPFDLIQWLMDTAPEGEQQNPSELTLRIIGINFAAVHTSSMTFTHAFYWLAARPECVPALREDVAAAVTEHGWTKAGLNQMYKIDSFLKESMRHTGIATAIMGRKAVKNVTFSDGTQIPAGAHVAINLWSIHHDPEIYPNPDEFDPFRFSRKVEQGEGAVKHAFTTASSDFLLWGGGAHVCAGRNFASMLLKSMLAHIVTYYDVQFPNGAQRPPNLEFGSNVIPNPKATILVRRRQA